MGFVRKIGRQIDDAVHAIVEDPLQAIVTVGAMAMGVPPVWAGAIGGAAGAAEHGTNILEGAALGGITGYAGGAAGGLAAEAGAGQILAGAAGGAAAGATGAALTGNDIVSGALTGGVLGGGTGAVSSYFNPETGNSTYTYDDGSTITKTAGGDVVGSTPSNAYGLGAPVVDLSTPSTGGPQLVGGPAGGEITNPVVDTGVAGPVAPQAPVDLVSTGYSDSEAGTVYQGPNGPEVVLDSGKTVLISDLEKAIASGKTISVDGNMVTDFKAEMSGIPRSTENPGTGNLPPGTELASIDNSNGAKWDDNLNTYVNPTTGAYFSQESNAWVQPAGTTPIEVTGGNGNTGVPGNYVAPVTVNPDGSSQTINWNGSITTTYADGTSVTSNPDGSSVIKDTGGTTHVTGPGTGSGGGVDMGNGSTTYTYDDGSSITIHPDGTSTSTPAHSDVTTPVDNTPEITITGDRPKITLPTGDIPVIEPGVIDTTIPTTPVVETPAPPTEIVDPYNPDPYTPTPVTPIFPVVVPPKPPVTPVTPSVTVTPNSNLDALHIPTGLNPGWIAPTPFYQTTSPVQSQYYWGPHSFQQGPTFNQQQWNTVPGAGTHGWGLQQMGDVARPQDIVDYINSPEYQAQFVSGPAVPGRG